MTLIPVEYHGVHTAGPEQFTCVLLRWAEQNRILPIWMSPLAAAELDIRQGGYTPRRPGTIDLLLDLLNRSTGGVTAVNIISHYEGVFIASLVLADGEQLDARPSDALLIARALELEIHVEEDVLNQASFFVSDDVLEEYFGLRFDSAPTTSGEELSASGDAEADADFEQMMRSLGMSESDFFEGNGPADAGPESDSGPDDEEENTEKD
ncbi:bifunctional nuclease family protein [Corynebacterium hylobatis]|uniref:Bifunctional nuclease family protein n=1 Tax=Corynebacterium hylobatis TaxID=1859290 RepID=A0A430HYJ7_9CORY|nr:bifunctional nuclease family protein [Corynebacterium hylobatis]RSZ63430.1 bifunctional nuclease family protein [Corynebacterium hylobatis]